jgi:D-alanyl-D-alanine carboxypeptidase
MKQLPPPPAPSAATKHEPTQAGRKSEAPAVVAKIDGPTPAAAAPATVTPPARTTNSEPTRLRSEPAAKPPVRSGWVIQVGAYPAEEEARQRLNDVKSKAAKMLVGADPFTETVEKAGTTYYRARFAGFDKDKAEAACKYLKRNDVDCVTVKN